jgi:heat shock protein beta
VADRVSVTTKSNDDGKTWVWSSELNSSNYSIKEAETPMTRGTRITLSLKDGCEAGAYTRPRLSST